MTNLGQQEVPSVRQLLQLSVPAIIVGVVSALGLFLVDEAAHYVEEFLWVQLPQALNVSPDSGWWIFGVLSLVGLAIGLIVTFVHGHGGTDSATVELVAPPMSLGAVPGLVLVTILGLAGGVSLGPESAIIAVNTAILVTLVNRLWPEISVELVVMVSAAGTIGALFGTPVAAILVLTGVVAAAKTGGTLWDRLFLPLLSASMASITMAFLGAEQLRPPAVPSVDGTLLQMLPAAVAVACVAALVGLLGATFFQPLHASFRRLKRPILYTTLGGMLLGLLGALGGPLTLFKGSAQMVELVDRAGEFTAWQLAGIVGIKLLALLIAATAGFRGGRIFPAVFIGVAVGLLCHALIPQIPIGLAIGCGALGMVLAVSRDGWIAIFIAVVVAGDMRILPVLCFVVLPVWLLVARAPEMLAHTPAHAKQNSK
ncbi:ion channel protein [Paeniglutamicibacter sp. NPDC012692]|uniref:ion channel protein n=1 Tax=Paeniglutamicibacter sp. NPDC012692 TaxID=3364388 RepID=UPI0036983B2B